eukprot:TRINITY_DN12667_c0_g1_i1.p1 TRINITY_DN12667_c0_g1~~TRINITY_DN12667_c0_g1_i1.p1  ORF type:complete len:406 (+),score=77.95 TRINITY_DN12667_c0_g1_i1:60-1277(+)
MLSILTTCFAATQASKDAQLQTALQGMLNQLAEDHPYGMQLAWKSDTTEFLLSSGSVNGKKVTTDDTFLFGSGTKPITSSVILTLVEKGLVDLDKPAYTYLDPILTRMNQTTLSTLFGQEVNTATVRHILAMQSGIQDFDWPDYDKQVLAEGNRTHPPIEFVVQAASQPQKLICNPGECVCYSSTNYILAGLIIMQVTGHDDWTTFTQMQHLTGPAATALSGAHFFANQNLTQYLTCAGRSGSQPMVPIEDQSSSILGFTCGNLVGTALHMARFMHALVHQKDILSADILNQMETFKPLSTGWAKGRIQYGLGLMIQPTSLNATLPPVASELGSYIGHGGDTYGFLSEQGYYSHLNATMVVIANTDAPGYFVQNVMACNAVKVAAPIVLGVDAPVKCIPMKLSEK